VTVDVRDGCRTQCASMLSTPHQHPQGRVAEGVLRSAAAEERIGSKSGKAALTKNGVA